MEEVEVYEYKQTVYAIVIYMYIHLYISSIIN